MFIVVQGSVTKNTTTKLLRYLNSNYTTPTRFFIIIFICCRCQIIVMTTINLTTLSILKKFSLVAKKSYCVKLEKIFKVVNTVVKSPLQIILTMRGDNHVDLLN